MALILILAGTLSGSVAALLQWIFADVSLMQAAGTYFTFGLGLPISVGLAKALEVKLRGLLGNLTPMQARHADS